ncbi:hypothetical protein [Clostridium paridis]|uniref:Uncharacterized protein n=1 Tax=Clostridium paridis TaxID=2803863 RepID=A0A937FCZ0_9CLOT|nr:hypothetical protein [Clostridium paridis]MBL4930904.1 hypothetical protein [Clostridium paridis]
MLKNKKVISISAAIICIILIALIIIMTKNKNGNNENIDATKVSTEKSEKSTEQTEKQSSEQQPQKVATNTAAGGATDVGSSGGVPVHNGAPGSTDNGGGSSTPAQPPVNQGISTIYGEHTYGVNNQDEYSAVMSKARGAIGSGDINQYVYSYLDGDRAENHPAGSDAYNWLNLINEDIGYMNHKVGKDATLKFVRARAAANALSRSTNASNPYNGTPSSAYDVLFRGLKDCDANAQVKSAVFDVSGFSSSVRYASGHAWLVVNVGGTWFSLDGAPVGLNGNAVPHSSPN